MIIFIKKKFFLLDWIIIYMFINIDNSFKIEASFITLEIEDMKFFDD
jgi:hypothetical protein